MINDKKILQDVTPPKRSIQDIPIPTGKNRKNDLNRSTSRKKAGFFGSSKSKKAKKTKRNLLIFVVLLVLLSSAFFFLMSSSVVITITPIQLQERVDASFIAVSEKETGGVPFDIMMLDETGSKEVQSTSEEVVKEKASGKIVIFNNFSKVGQRLIKNTRFETSEGLTYRIQNSVVVPGQTVDSEGETVPGNIEVIVYADQPGEEYNIGLADFTIPGFAGSERFDKFYARSKTTMTGGFEGVKKIASEEDVEKARAELSKELEQKLSTEILSKIPENFILYDEGLFVRSSFIGTVDSGEGKEDMVDVKEKVSVYAVIFDRDNLNRQIANDTLDDYQGEEIMITNLGDLNFEIKNRDEVEPWTEGRFIFSLKGEVSFEWLYDEEKLKNDFVGQSKNETNINNILANYSGIESAKMEITPFWKKSFPRSTSKIQVIKDLENN
ncbi:MAG: hypothetical protein U9P50_00435 [Patescibacteria group bacterium]|nr:hypothetical protein [Patescibacteria group bacterium]